MNTLDPSSARALVFVDSRVQDSATLLGKIPANAEVVVLRAGEDGLAQMAAALAAHGPVGSVQVLAHGSAGDLWLGNSYLSAENVAAHSDLLAKIGAGIVNGGDLLIYACDTAHDERGAAFVHALAQLTARDVAASDNRTGAGGDWNLEITTGAIESKSVLSAEGMSHYAASLSTITVVNNFSSGVGSLRDALATAQNGDTITFNAGMTVALTTGLVVNKNVTIDGDLNNDNVADVTIDAQYKARAIDVSAGTTATFDGLVITHGLAAGNGGNGGSSATTSTGGAIYNQGTLTLNNVSVTANMASGGGGGGGVTPQYAGGGGGGGGAPATGIGGNGGNTLNSAGSAGTTGQGGAGGGFFGIGGRGGTTTGGAGGAAYPGYSTGSGAGTATSGSLSIGGGGGGDGYNAIGGAGGGAVGGIYNATGATLTIIGNSAITNNVGAGGGGGGGGAGGGYTQAGGAGGIGVGAIWNKGLLQITSANVTAMTGNVGGGGTGGTSAGTAGASPAGVATVYNDGGTYNNNYSVAPTASIVVADNALKIGETSAVTITFSTAVTGFDNADLSIANGTLSAVTSSDNITWTAVLTPTASVTDSTNLITLDNTGVRNSQNTPGVGTTSSNNYAVDTVRPGATIVVADNALSVGETSLVTVTFTEAVTGFTTADLTVANGAVSGLSSADGGITWTATLTPSASTTDATNLLTLDNTGVADTAGNAGTGTTDSNNYAIDTVRPTAGIVVADHALSVGETSLVTFTFSEAVTGFTTADLSVANGSLSGLSSADGGITWTATLTPTASIADTTNVITLTNSGVIDAAGNAGTGTTDSNNYAVDTARPTATIVVADNALSVGETSLVTVTFSEAVTGLTAADLTVANGAISALSSSDGGITWTATLTPSASTTDATNVVTLDNTGVADAAGNVGSGSTDSNNYAVDTVRPSATVVVADSALAAGETSLVTVTFSEAVTGFTAADLTVANGAISGLSSADGGITWTATLTPSASTTDATNLVTLDNTGVADAAGNAGTGSTDSNNYAIDTARPTAGIVVADNALSIGETSLVTFTFSEAVTGFTAADLTVANGAISALNSADGGITWTATLTPSAATSDATNVVTLDNTGVADAAGNAGSGTTDSNNYAVDTARPTASIVVADNALGVGETSLVTVTFSEAVTGFTSADLTVANGAISGLGTADGGITWTATLTPSASTTDATNVLTLDNTGVADTAGNAGTGTTDSNNYAIDTVRPTASIVVADTALSVGETSLVTFTFSEAVAGFTTADLTVANGSVSSLSSADGGVTWTATLTPTASTTDTTNLITLDNTGIADTAGNAGAGTTDSNNYAIDTARPTATIVVADNALSVGETSALTVTFSEAVTGFTAADLTVANGSVSSLSSADGGITWTATLTPSASTTDATNVVTLDNTGVADAAGNAGTGTTDSNNYAIDNVRPTATIVVADTALAVGETSAVTFTFTEAVTGFTAADLTVANGAISGLSSADGGITWTATLTPSASTTDATNLITLDNTGVADLGGNAGTGSTDSNNYAIDTTRPSAAIVVADNALGIGETSLVTFTFSEAVTGFTAADLTVANGGISGLSSADGGITWTATLTPTVSTTDATNLITLDNTGVADAAGNAGAGSTDSSNYAIDNVRPTAAIVVADSALSTGETSAVTFTFTEAVTGFTAADLTVANGAISGLATADGGITWTATLTPSASTIDATNLITLDNTGVADLAGNAGTGTTDSNNYAIDTVRPSAAIVVADNALSAGETSLVTFTFTEAVTGFTATDLTVANGAISGLSTSDGGTTWTATLTPSASTTDATNVLTLDNTGIADLAGNAGTGTTNSNNYAIDTVRPNAGIVVADSALTAGETSLVTFTFNEAVTGFTTADLTVGNGAISGLSSADGDITWTATLTPTASTTDATNVLTLDNTGVADLAGNAGSGSTDSNNYAIDNVRPTATIVVADNALSVGETSLVTFTFTEAVTGFTAADLTVANGAVSGLSTADGGITWTATLTPTASTSDATNVLTLDNTGVADLAGNAGTGSTDSNNYAIDTVRPSAGIVVADNALSVGETSLVTFTFTEAVTGFTTADLTVANGSVSSLSSGDGGITWTATLTPTASTTDATNLITLDNTGIADTAGNAGTGATNSNNYAIDTVRPTATVIVADANLTVGETSLVTITFSEAVTGLTGADLTVANGSVGTISSSDGGVTWTATLTPSAGITDATNLLVLDNSGVADLAGNAGSGTTDSNNYAIDTFVNSAPTGSVTIGGTPTQGQVLTAANTLADVDGMGTIAYQWRADGVDIGGATAGTFTLTEAQVGKAITVAASYTDGHNTAESVTSAATAAVANVNDLPSGAVTISGSATQGQILSAANTLADLDGLGTIGYQWRADGVDIGGATAGTFTLTEAQVGKAITVAASYTDGHGTAESVVSGATATVANVNDLPTGTVTISGSATQGQTLTAANTLADADGLGTISYQWQADGVDISGAVAGTLTLTEAQVGKAIGVVASYVDGHGQAESAAATPTAAVANVNDAPTGTLVIGGSAIEGQTLSATNTIADADGLGTISYQWQADGVDIAGAVTSSLTLGQAQVGKAITLSASYVDGHGTPETVSSSATASVANLNQSPTGAVTISGTATQGQTLTAANTLTDTDGLGTISYQWLADGSPIAGAVASGLTLTEAQVGKAISVVASYTDGYGTPESATATATSPVVNVNDLPSGIVTIAGNAVVGETITASNTLTDADGLGTIAYQWRADGANIGGAVNASFVLTAAQIGKVMTVVASYVDGHGTPESVASSAGAAVSDLPPVVSVTVDGVATQTSIVPNAATGLDEEIVNVPVTNVARPDDPTSPHPTLADIPLDVSSGTGTNALTAGLTVSLPTGAGFESSGSADLLTNDQALKDLIARIDSKTVDGSPTALDMQAQGANFLDALADSTLLATRTLVPVAGPSAGATPTIIIAGTSPATAPGATQATALGLVIDTKGLPAGAILQLDNVDFAAIVGASTLRGGAGQNFVIGDDAAQNMVLGGDDDILFGGGGDDIVGSAGGNDRLDGGSGSDIVFGGIGNDTLSGGTGNDTLQGGRSDTGHWDFYLNSQGQVVGMHTMGLVNPIATEVVSKAELNGAVAKLAFAQADQAALQTLSLLYHAAFNRTADLGGLSYWTQSSHTNRELIQGFMQTKEWQDSYGKLDDAQFVNQVYTNALGHAGSADELAAALAQIQAAADHTQGRMQVLEAIALGSAHRAAWQTAAGMALGGETVTQEQGWINGGGNDRLDGGAGNDLLVGGDGIDTVVYAGARANYAVRLTADGQITLTDRGNGDVDRLVQIEQGAFSDGTVDLGFTQASQPLLQQVGLMYQTVLNRAGDMGGVGYWVGKGISALDLAGQLLGSAEFKQGGALTDAAFVTLLYKNALDRSPDAGGLAFWDTYLDTHTRAEMVVALTTSAEVIGNQYGTEGLWLV